jgi:hypothetical protein
MTFHQLASAEFQIGVSDTTVKVEGIPYVWDRHLIDRDKEAAYAVACYIGKHNLSQGKPITLLWVSSKPNNKDKGE